MKYNILKILLLQIIISISSLALSADSPTFKLQGGYEFQAALYRSNNTEKNQYVSANKKTIGFNSSGHVNVQFMDVIPDFMEYGAKISLETSSRNDRRVASFLYGISDYGKLELGSDKSANSKMKITGHSVGCATAGGWDVWVNLPRDRDTVAYVTSYSNFLDAKTRASDKVEYSRKITYFTPKLNGFQLGVSYIPDTSNAGYSTFDKGEFHKLSKPSEYQFGITDGVAYGISHEAHLSDDLKINTAIVGESGKIKKVFEVIDGKNKDINIKFKNLSTYIIGSELHYKKFAIAAGYGDYMKSFTSEGIENSDKIGRSTKIYSLGTRYKYNDKIAGSLNYFHSNYKRNIVNATTVAVDYLFTPGLLSYAEFTYYTTNGKYLLNNSSTIQTDKTNGQLLIVGTKLEF